MSKIVRFKERLVAWNNLLSRGISISSGMALLTPSVAEVRSACAESYDNDIRKVII